MTIIKIIKNGKTSYYLTQIEHQALAAFANVINSTPNSDIKIRMTEAKPYVPVNIHLDDSDLRYFDLIEIFRDRGNSKPSLYTINKIAEECAYNEEYCDFVCDFMVDLTKQSATDAKVGKFIADTVITRALEIIEKHKENVTNAFYKYYKENKNAEIPEKIPEMTMEEEDNSVQIDDSDDDYSHMVIATPLDTSNN